MGAVFALARDWGELGGEQEEVKDSTLVMLHSPHYHRNKVATAPAVKMVVVLLEGQSSTLRTSAPCKLHRCDDSLHLFSSDPQDDHTSPPRPGFTRLHKEICLL